MFVVKKRIIRNLLNICEERNLEEFDILLEDFYLGDEDLKRNELFKLFKIRKLFKLLIVSLKEFIRKRKLSKFI